MSILLKEQLIQAKKLNEITYHMPIYNTHFYDSMRKTSYGTSSMGGTKMFYDFYAMEFLWSFLGSGSIPRKDRKKWKELDPDDSGRDVVSNASHKFLPHAAVKIIDDVYEQVTRTVAKQLISYIRMAVVQEFRYLVGSASGWVQFRNAIMGEYNTKSTISKKQFNNLIRQNIPDMEKHPEVVKRLLKFSKYYSPIHAFDDKDTYDISRNSTEEPETDNNIADPIEDPVSSTPEEELPYDGIQSTEREFGKYSPENPSPYEEPWSGLSTFNSVEDEPEENDDSKEKLTEGLDPEKIKKVHAAMNKAGITLNDIAIAFNDIAWVSTIGGESWGTGAVALLKLMDAKKNMDTEDLNHIIDHIYDLQHNTGSLLNKGPMYVTNQDLNRRFKITNVARFIPFVSPIIKNLIIRYQKYLYDNPEKAELELEKNDILKTPLQDMSPEENTFLSLKKFFRIGKEWRSNVKFLDKQGDPVHGVFYNIRKHADGRYSLNDNLMADIQIFKTFPELQSYIKNFEKDIIPNAMSHFNGPITGKIMPPANAAITTPSSVTPSAFNKSALPPNPPTNTIYTVHTGIESAPTAIRLTKEDEDKIGKVGFYPSMIGSDVWYINKSDANVATVKFFPNNTAIYGKGSSASPHKEISINNMILWLVNNSHSLMTTSNKKGNGVKVSPMTEKYILAAGFKWNSNINEYTDGENKLIIHPDKSSDIYLPGIDSYHFNGLPTLIRYLNKKYPEQKIGSSKTSSQLALG